MVKLPLPPRLARLVIAAESDDEAALACELAALLSERDLVSRSAGVDVSDCDLEVRWRLLHKYPPVPGAKAVGRVATDLQRILKQAAQPPGRPIPAGFNAGWLPPGPIVLPGKGSPVQIATCSAMAAALFYRRVAG